MFQSTPPVKAATSAKYYFTILYMFQSTPPVKAATVETPETPEEIVVSIHAAREGGDIHRPQFHSLTDRFNPRRP